jgi:hypothetical protein
MGDPYDTALLSRDAESHEFRLVELQPPSAISHPINCNLRVYILDDHCPAYTALSYTWSSPLKPRIIDLNGVTFHVGRNLWAFLDQMNIQRRYGLYWIDAICINQKSVLERNHQVQMMRQIYSKAQSVAVWLREATYGSPVDIAMEYLSAPSPVKSISDNSNIQSVAEWLKNYDAKGIAMEYLSAPSPIKPFSDPTPKNFPVIWTHEQHEGIVRLFYNGYWTRVWIVQELMVAKHVTIYCATKSISWEALENMVIYLEAMGKKRRVDFDLLSRTPYPNGRDIIRSPAANLIKSKSRQAKSPRSLVRLLYQYKKQEATNRLDKVYALHGLASDSYNFAIDYQISPEELLVKLVHHVCMKTDPGAKKSRVYRSIMAFGEMMASVLGVNWAEEETRAQCESAASIYNLEASSSKDERQSEVLGGMVVVPHWSRSRTPEKLIPP